MPSLDGYRAWLEIDGKELKEYPENGPINAPSYLEYDEKPEDFVGIELSYVVSIPQKKFDICWSVPKGVSVEAVLFLENVAVGATQLRHQNKTRTIRERFGVDQEGKYREFVFERLTIDVDAAENAPAAPLLGTIQVELSKGTFPPARPKQSRRVQQRALTARVSENTKALQEHTVRLGAQRELPLEDEGFRVQESEFHVHERRLFIFKYNSRALLEAERKIPTEEEQRHEAELAAERERLAALRAQHEVEIAILAAQLREARERIDAQEAREVLNQLEVQPVWGV